DDSCAIWEGGVDLGWGPGCCGKRATAVENAAAYLRLSEVEMNSTAAVDVEELRGKTPTCSAAGASTTTTTDHVDRCNKDAATSSTIAGARSHRHPARGNDFSSRFSIDVVEDLKFAAVDDLRSFFCRACDFNGTCAWNTEIAGNKPIQYDLEKGPDSAITQLERPQEQTHGPAYQLYRAEFYGRVVAATVAEMEKRMRSEIYKNGPIVCGVAVSEESVFQNYRFEYGVRLADVERPDGGGARTNALIMQKKQDLVHDSSSASRRIASVGVASEPDHVVTLVGYGKVQETPYWSGKNSYGTNWGLRGFFYLERGVNLFQIESGHCSFAVPDRRDVARLVSMAKGKVEVPSSSEGTTSANTAQSEKLDLHFRPDPHLQFLLDGKENKQKQHLRADRDEVQDESPSQKSRNLARLDPAYWTEMSLRREKFHKLWRGTSTRRKQNSLRNSFDSFVIPPNILGGNNGAINPRNLSPTTTVVAPSKILSQFAGKICYHCWAAALIATFSDRIRIASKGLLDPTVSMQTLLNFDDSLTGGDCRSGMAIRGAHFLKHFGASDETNAPYRGHGFAWGIECCGKMSTYEGPGALGNKVL
ncbi:unnamed protein product, partial [Amoebophrya sp. A120]